MKTICVVLALAACVAVAQAVPAEKLDTTFVDPNAQSVGFQASLTGAKLAGNPLGLTAAQVQREGMDPPSAGVTFASQTNAEVSTDRTQWTWEYDGFNVENVGETTIHNIKDPKWPVVMTMFKAGELSSPDYLPIIFGELTKDQIDALATGLVDATGKNLGYKTIMDAVNASALGVVSRMANDPNTAVFGVLGNDMGASELTGGIDMPVNDETFIPLTEEEIANLPDPDDLKPPKDSSSSSSTPTPTPTTTTITTPAAGTPTTPSPSPSPSPAPAPKSGASRLQTGAALAFAAIVGMALLF